MICRDFRNVDVTQEIITLNPDITYDKIEESLNISRSRIHSSLHRHMELKGHLHVKFQTI